MGQEEEIQQPNTTNRATYNANLPVIYTNGILVTLTVSDLSLTLTVNGQPTHILNMSLTTAKTLYSNINEALQDFQDKTKTKVLEINDVRELMRKDKQK